jgi:hypothetical protein
VHSQERIKTNDTGVAQLEFLDKTSLSVGPMSEVRLDRFVYNPASGTGQVIVNVGRGAFRFVTGTQDSKNYSIQTPHATLGVRGTVFEVVITDDDIDVHLVEGGVSVRTALGQLIDLTPDANRLKVFRGGGVQGPTFTPPNQSILTFTVLKSDDSSTASIGRSAGFYASGPITTPVQQFTSGLRRALSVSGLDPTGGRGARTGNNTIDNGEGVKALSLPVSQ